MQLVKPTSRWVIAIIGWLVLLLIYVVWKSVENHVGGGFITGFLRGGIVFGGAYILYRWAKNNGGNHNVESDKK